MRNLQFVSMRSGQISLKIFTSALLLGICLSLNAQISEGGVPKSFTLTEVDESQVFQYIFDKPIIEELLEEDIERDSHGYNLRDAVAIPVSLNLNNSGTWFDLDNGDRLWRLKVKVPEALSLEAYYDEFFIPIGCELYIYNADGSEYYGAFTHRNNKPSGRMSTEMIQGDIINFEYYEAQGQSSQSEISIMDLAYRYRDVIGVTDPEENGAQSCEVDVSCSEGDIWADQINSAVRLRTRINGQFFWSTGTIMNNTAQDCRPLILTSMRCAIDGNDHSTQLEMDQYRFYFGYQSSACSIGEWADLQTLTGCQKIGDSNDDGGALGSDFLIVELTSDIPLSYDSYYAGWDATGVALAGGGACFHHPSGDVKKISTYASVPVSSPWGMEDTHWSVNWTGSPNGHGVTESGSFGAGLFNANGRVIGTLTGGISNCNDVQPGGQFQPDLFGKMSHHWSGNPNPFDEKLRMILDPINANAQIFDGSSNPCGATSLGELEQSELKLWPNPTSSWVTISLGDQVKDYSVEILDISGRSVLIVDRTAAEPVSVNLSDYPAGIYLIRLIKNDVEISIQRLIIKH